MTTALTVQPLATSGPDDLPRQVCSLLRHYARRRRHEPGMVEALSASTGDVASLLARGIVAEASSTDDPYAHMLRALPELWWLDLEAGIHALPRLAALLPSETATRLRSDALTLVSRLDHAERPAAWETPGDVFLSLIDEDPEPHEREQVLARGVALAIAMAPDWLATALEFVRRGPSRALLRALCRDGVLLDQPRFLGALTLRGGPRTAAMAAACAYFAPESAIVRLRDLLASAPAAAAADAAQIYGLLSLVDEERLPAAEALRTAVSTQVWRGEDLSTIPWSRAFRGELLVADALGELGDAALPLAMSAASGLCRHLDTGALKDPVLRDALALCLAHSTVTDADYVAPMRLAEARLAELEKTASARVVADAIRAYAWTLLEATTILAGTRGARSAAYRLYGRLKRLRRAHPELLPRDLYPDGMEHALRQVQPPTPTPRTGFDTTGSTPQTPHSVEDPLPGPHEVTATAETLHPLPGPTASWVGARKWSLARLLGILLPLPFRHLWSCALRWGGCAPRASILLGKQGAGAMVVRDRILGATVRTVRRVVPSGRVWLFPEGLEGADRMLGNWSAVLILSATLGTWLLLGGAPIPVAWSTLGGVAVIAFGLVGYAGAVMLRRVVATGEAVAVRDADDRVTVWRIAPTTRLVLLDQT